ncbi:hypothetical protein [Paenibacillus aceti]|uniref:Replication initiation factor n=1 Tax=Paenibacillus aceti TaxID=1820010 RepID=A0ABQ1W539_9BACL|nr:hypothetical protein [Paenibacillus aceti]GGG15507.1 hypothetical protein GCM10010913_41800 [Paenibacillus aceti]
MIDVSVDTLCLVSKLNSSQISEVYNHIDFTQWNGNKVWKHCIYNKEEGYYIYFIPRGGNGKWLGKHYNIMILLQKEALLNKPAIIEYLIRASEWTIKRLDIAFDYYESIDRSFLLRSGKSKFKPYKGTSNYYYYGDRNSKKICHYDKKNQLLERKNIVIDEDVLTRFEVRLRPKLKDRHLINGDFGWVQNELSTIKFVANSGVITKHLKTKEDKQYFRNIKRRQKQDWTSIPRSNKTRIRKVIDEHAIDLHEECKKHGVFDQLKF